jgi:hypothetical protein
MDYFNLYAKLLEKSLGRTKQPNDGLEKHRILPGHQGGTYDINNVALLTFNEHRLAHKLLFKMYSNIGDLCAANLMSSNLKDKRLVTAMASHIHQKHRKEGFWSSEKQHANTLKSIEKQRKTGFAFHRSDRQKANSARANRRVISLDDGKITSWVKRLIHEKKTAYSHTWVEL